MIRKSLLLITPLAATTALLAFRAQRPMACDAENAGLSVPTGYCATLFAEVRGARHVAVAPNGDVFVATHARGDSGGVVALRDRDNDGHADTTAKFGSVSGTGVALTTDALYFAPADRVIRYSWKSGSLTPAGEGTVIVNGMPTGGHTAKTIAIGRAGDLYVDHGSAGNVCLERGMAAKSQGPRPCPELTTRAGIWRYDARKSNQTPADGERWVTGLRNGMAIAVEPQTGLLWGATHGRDNLAAWGFSPEDNAEKPAEEFGPLSKGADYGWPYCYYDPIAKKKMQAPEYGGDGVTAGECAAKTQPAIAFPGHWAPLQLSFNTGAGFGAAYRGGAFLAFRGSWNRAPLPQAGHRIVYIPFTKGKATGAYSTFANGNGADIKFSGVAMRPDGSAMYISSDQLGKVWRIIPNTGR